MAVGFYTLAFQLLRSYLRNNLYILKQGSLRTRLAKSTFANSVTECSYQSQTDLLKRNCTSTLVDILKHSTEEKHKHASDLASRS